ncbi:gnat family acetyltransferase [Gigaspora margarita]|uniref:Gnat family acetyltransferase n=1 Tax=Gigaspora margarita TaxID=4874 RepID=A0A8H4ELM3_GIGMA|nr:gnat family acetyltransferase [Gigaspora margarita]
MSSEIEHQDLVLVEATPEQARITNRNSYMDWGYPLLTIDEYIEREEILANNEFTSENFKVWILVSKKCNLLNDTEPTIFSQCETFKLKALITLSSGQIQEVIGYYIGSLFTPPQYRHKGYATKLMELLNDKLRFEYKAKFSYLHSAIGSDFYSRLGWRIFPHKEIKFKVDDRFSTSLKHSELIIAINESNLETIINKDCEFIRKDLKKLNKKSMAILPTKPAFDWLFQKTKLYSKFYADTNDPRQFGAMILNKKKESINENEELLERFILWNHDFMYNQLFIIRFRSDSPYTTRLLIQQAMQEASKFQFKQIILWNPDLRLFNISEDLNVFDVEVVEKTEFLPYLSWYADDDDDVDWILIEKYSLF